MMKWFHCKCCEGAGDWAPLVLRLSAGTIFFAHGWQKFGVLPVFGDFLDSLGVPMPVFFAGLVVGVELIGGAALVAGFLTHWVAKLLAIDMLVAFFLVHWQNGVFVQNNGFELVLLLLAVSVALALFGAGHWSLDGMWHKKK